MLRTAPGAVRHGAGGTTASRVRIPAGITALVDARAVAVAFPFVGNPIFVLGALPGLLARTIHEARSENADSDGDSRPSDRRPPLAYSTVRRGGRREKVAKIRR
jgi:hypothetical protein